MASENGTLAKLTEVRKAFLQDAEAAAGQYRATLKDLRDNYLNQVVDVTLGDPRLAALNQVFASQPAPTPVAPAPSTTSIPAPGDAGSTVLATDQATELPTKMPMKRLRVANCSSCGARVQDLNARFCSQCASPLFEF